MIGLEAASTLAEQLVVLLKTSSSLIDIDAKVQDIAAQFATFKVQMFDHFSEEETFWPPSISKYGQVLLFFVLNNVTNFYLFSGFSGSI
jgi:hypothetical protein